MKKVEIMTPRKAYHIVTDELDLDPEVGQFCDGVMELWGAHPIDPDSLSNMGYMLKSIFVAGVYFGRAGGTVEADV